MDLTSRLTLNVSGYMQNLGQITSATDAAANQWSSAYGRAGTAWMNARRMQENLTASTVDYTRGVVAMTAANTKMHASLTTGLQGIAAAAALTQTRAGAAMLAAQTMSTRFTAMGVAATAMGERVSKSSGGFIQLGMAMTAVGAVLAASIALSVREAAKFEESMAGVRKTINPTEQEFRQLSTAFRELSKQSSVSANDLALIAGVAGQLGIRGSESIIKFTDTISKLVVATNLTAEQAALDMATFAGIMDEPIENVDKLASSLVHLGNTSRTSETKILDFATRISGVGKIMGFTSDQVLGIAAGFASVGIEAELGGTAVQQVMVKMNEAVQGGTNELRLFAAIAKLAGDQSVQTADDFAALAKSDVKEAWALFMEGLSRTGKQGAIALQQLGLEGQRVISSFLRMAAASGTLDKSLSLSRDSLNRAAQGYKDQNAHIKEFETRMNTLVQKLKQFANVMVDMGIEIGNSLLPALKIITDVFSAIGSFVSQYPTLLKLAAAVAGITGAIFLLGGAVSAFMFLLGPMLTGIGTLLGLMSGGVITSFGAALTGVVVAIGGWPLALGAAAIVLAAFLADTKDGREAIAAFAKDVRETFEMIRNTPQAVRRIFGIKVATDFGDTAAQYAVEQERIKALTSGERNLTSARARSQEQLKKAAQIEADLGLTEEKKFRQDMERTKMALSEKLDSLTARTAGVKYAVAVEAMTEEQGFGAELTILKDQEDAMRAHYGARMALAKKNIPEQLQIELEAKRDLSKGEASLLQARLAIFTEISAAAKREQLFVAAHYLERATAETDSADELAQIHVQALRDREAMRTDDLGRERMQADAAYIEKGTALVNALEKRRMTNSDYLEAEYALWDVHVEKMAEINRKLARQFSQSQVETAEIDYNKRVDADTAIGELYMATTREMEDLNKNRFQLEEQHITDAYNLAVSKMDDELALTKAGEAEIERLKILRNEKLKRLDQERYRDSAAALADYTEEARQYYEDDTLNAQREYARVYAKLVVHFELQLAAYADDANARLGIEADYEAAKERLRKSGELSKIAASNRDRLREARDRDISLHIAAERIRGDEAVLKQKLDALETLNNADQRRMELVIGIAQQEAQAAGRYGDFIIATFLRAGNAIESFWNGLATLSTNTIGHITRALDEGLFQLFKTGTVDMKSLWEGLMDDMLREITRFLANQAVKQLIMLVAGAFGFDVGTGTSGGGGVLGSGGGTATGGSTASLATQLGLAIGSKVGTTAVGDVFRSGVNALLGGGSGNNFTLGGATDTIGGVDTNFSLGGSGGGSVLSGGDFSLGGSGGSSFDLGSFSLGGSGSSLDLGSFSLGGGSSLSNLSALESGVGMFSTGAGSSLLAMGGGGQADFSSALNDESFLRSLVADANTYSSMMETGSVGTQYAAASMSDIGGGGGRSFDVGSDIAGASLATAASTPGAWTSALNYLGNLGTNAAASGVGTAINLGTTLGLQALLGVPTTRAEAAGQKLAGQAISSVLKEGAQTGASTVGVGTAPTSGLITGTQNLVSNYTAGGLSGALFGTAGGETAAAQAAQASALGAGANIATASEAAAAAGSGSTGATGGYFGAGGQALGAGASVAGVALSAGTAAWNFTQAFDTLAGGSGGMTSEAQMNAAYGTLAGMAAGAVAGAVIGSVVPGIGTAIGAVIGAALGSTGGGMIGGLFGDPIPPAIHNKMERAETAVGTISDVFRMLGSARDAEGLHDMLHAPLAGTSSMGELLHGLAKDNLQGSFSGPPWMWKPDPEIGVLIPLLESMGITKGAQYNNGRVNSTGELLAATGSNPESGAKNWGNLLRVFAGAVSSQYPGLQAFAMPALDDFGLAARYGGFSGPRDPRIPATVQGWDDWISGHMGQIANTAGYSVVNGWALMMERQGFDLWTDLLPRPTYSDFMPLGFAPGSDLGYGRPTSAAQQYVLDGWGSSPPLPGTPEAWESRRSMVGGPTMPLLPPMQGVSDLMMIPGYARGGSVDTVLGMLTPGEFVSTTGSSSRNGAALEAGNAGAMLTTVGEGEITINITINGDVKDPHEFARAMAPMLRDEIRKIDDRRSSVSGRRGG